MDHELIDEAKAYAEKIFSGNADGHGFEHTLRVYQNAMEIARQTDCDREIVALSALLHDVDDGKLFRTEHNANARHFLTGHGVEQTERIISAINAVSFSKNKARKPDTIEGQIVQDADRLDAIGAIGIARTFSYGGSHGRGPEASIGHFYEKLLLLKDLMNTETARNMAEERHEFMLAFLREWDKETDA